MIKLDEAVALVHDWAKNRQDTLVLITADHETGGFGFSYIRGERPAPRSLPGAAFHGEKFQPRHNFGNYDILDRIYEQKLSYPEIMERFDALPEGQRTPKALAAIIETATAFPITERDASVILGRGVERDSQGQSVGESATVLPETYDQAFCPAGKSFRNILLARIVSKDQMTVWATGMHTNTPVPLIAYGPSHVSRRYGRMMHTTELGRQTIHILSHGE
jgi:alkaline phosphatase